VTDQHTAPEGEEPDVNDQGSFPDGAAEMADETEVEDPIDLPGESAGDGAGESSSDELVLAQLALADRTSDLQRLQAEYLNYKRRVERDRDLVRENATYAALAPITEVLDTIDRAREHAVSDGGELEGGFRTVAEQLERTVAMLGLTKFGQPGDAFDPAIHEALSHLGQDDDVQVTTCKVIAKAGYMIGSRVVRAAQVLVVDPA
jgi:molecular chaperone GrpE